MSLLTVDEFRAAVPGTVPLEDAAIALLLAGTEAAIAAVAGPTGTVTALLDGGTTYVILPVAAASITTVTERSGDVTTELDPTDFEIRFDMRSIRRRSDGLNPATWWAPVVTIEFEASDLSALQKLAQIELMKLEITSNPALAGQVVGNWAVQFQQGKTYAELRADILASLTRPWRFA